MRSTPTPTQVVLLQELDRWNLLAYRMGVSFGDLQKAVVGEIGMSDDLDAVGTTASAGRRERRRRVLRQGTFPRRRVLGSRAWCLAPQKPKQLVEELLILQVIVIEASRLKLRNTFRTPVYVTQSRRNAMEVGLVFEADIYLPLTGYCKTSHLHQHRLLHVRYDCGLYHIQYQKKITIDSSLS
ncbi:Dynein heavy chain C-terminal domain [Phytophthora infestans]|uniref:Dynein heavy chain C-terminal domain n=1 Tax=Phytophthora infestans TaxID=4787 RepID=A0A8S9UNW7_PHYIN|nr:Dynein heavy chain C-terminal domain [Phytophthora infestans]KAF4144445.1 Dynein heavy chain C-terminal domain [Phytophthora infestans]